MGDLTPAEREDAREILEIRRRMDERKRREAVYRETRPETRRTGARTPSGEVIISPSGMAHLATSQNALQPICVHYDEGRTEGWNPYPGAWADVPRAIARCKDCIALS